MARAIQLLSAETGTTAAPTTAGDGVDAISGHPNDGVFIIKSSAGSGTMTCTVQLWGYSAAVGSWVPLDTVVLAEEESDNLAYADPITGLAAFEEFYAEVEAIAGTATALNAWIVAR